MELFRFCDTNIWQHATLTLFLLAYISAKCPGAQISSAVLNTKQTRTVSQITKGYTRSALLIISYTFSGHILQLCEIPSLSGHTLKRSCAHKTIWTVRWIEERTDTAYCELFYWYRCVYEFTYTHSNPNPYYELSKSLHAK